LVWRLEMEPGGARIILEIALVAEVAKLII
jgi:hypothetical protein